MPYPWVGLFYVRPQQRGAPRLSELKLTESELKETVEATVGLVVIAFESRERPHYRARLLCVKQTTAGL
jgi:hypothetical protein